MWMADSDLVVVDGTTIPKYPLMEAADEIARRAAEKGMVSRIVFMPSLDRDAGGAYYNQTQIIRIGVRDCHTALPLLICHEIAHAIDDWTGHSLSESVDVDVIDEPRELFAETYERACLEPNWVEEHREDVALLCHDMASEDVPSSLVPTWYL